MTARTAEMLIPFLILSSSGILALHPDMYPPGSRGKPEISP